MAEVPVSGVIAAQMIAARGILFLSGLELSSSSAFRNLSRMQRYLS